MEEESLHWSRISGSERRRINISGASRDCLKPTEARNLKLAPYIGDRSLTERATEI
jgi:hypothetical protein